MSLGSEFMTQLMAGADQPDWGSPGRTVELYDTTLRDGTQGEDVAFSVADKLRITLLLDELGVAYVEGGWPGSNPRDTEYFRRVRELDLTTTRVAAFGMTCRAGCRPEDDLGVKALVDAATPVVTLVGKSSVMHVREVLRTTPEENLRMIRDTVGHVKLFGREVIYDAEHFFDGYKLDPHYAIETLRAAQRSGADVLVMCDTNGGTMPWEVADIVRAVVKAFPGVRLGIHTHNDAELAVANSLAALRQGVAQVQGTINGYGERCGNANLCSLAPDIELKMGLRCLPQGALARLTRLSRTVAEMANLCHQKSLPFVGRSAFAHKGGMHAAAMRRNPSSYQHLEPAVVGNQSRVLVSDLSGRGNLLSKAEEHQLEFTAQQANEVVQEIKDLESRGYVFEGADASVAVLMMRRQSGYRPPFNLVDFKVVVENRLGRGITAEATVKIEIDGQVVHTVAEGTGPVDALDGALRKALTPVYPCLADFHLADYKVRILEDDRGPAATTRVLIDSHDGSRCWTTVGASKNIIEASWQALVDSLEYGLVGAGYERESSRLAG